MKVPDHRHRKGEDQDVAEDVEGCDRDVRWDALTAVAWNGWVPVERKGAAHACADENGHECPATDVT